jgi:hypothetical protein
MAAEPLLPLRQVGRSLIGKTSTRLKELKRSLYRLLPDPVKEAEPQCSSDERVILRSPPKMRFGRARMPLCASCVQNSGRSPFNTNNVKLIIHNEHMD